MKQSEIKLLILEFIGSLILILNIFVKTILNDYTIILFVVAMLALSYYMLGFEKSKKTDKKEIIRSVAIYSAAFLFLLYGLGIFIGYVHSPYSRNFWGMLKNILPITILIFSTELLRYNILKKSGNTKKMRFITVIFTTLIDMSIVARLYNIHTFEGFEEMLMVIVIPMGSKNIMLYEYILPIQTDLNIYLRSVLTFLIPVGMEVIINNRFEKKEKVDIRDENSLQNKILTAVSSIIMVIIIMLNSNAFRFATSAVGSGSMEPTIRVGDAILIDKFYQDHLDKLKVGDILVFRIEDSVYTHRIVDIDIHGQTYQISTKGDKKGNVQDDWLVTNKDVVGVVKGRIPLIGYPTVWLNQLMRGRGI